MGCALEEQEYNSFSLRGRNNKAMVTKKLQRITYRPSDLKDQPRTLTGHALGVVSVVLDKEAKCEN